MKKILAVFIIYLLILFPIAFAGPADKKMSRVIIEDLSNSKIRQLVTNGCIIKHLFRKGGSFVCPEEKIRMLDVREVRIFEITDIITDVQINADDVWAEGITGSGAVIGVLDTGIDMGHPELSDSIIGGYDFVREDSIPDDEHGHGTHVSGIITSNGVDISSKGVSPDASIRMYKVCDSGGTCYEDDVIAGLEKAVEDGVDVLSISLGGYAYVGEDCDLDFFAQKINWVADQGITVVVSSGNDPSGVSAPGCASGAIAVGSVDFEDNVVSSSGRGAALDIVAPGVGIYSTVIGGYGYSSGTSMAAPHVSGTIALLLEARSSLTTEEIKQTLYDTASPVNKCYAGLEVPCTSEITGAGVVDAYGAYIYVKNLEDEDDDGVSDSFDKCPETESGKDVDVNGCSADQFCNSFNYKHSIAKLLGCTRADWKNNEDRNPRDCNIDRWITRRSSKCVARKGAD